MHHRALCLLPSPSAPSIAIASSFTSLLQAAAGRAWTRRVTTLPSPAQGTKKRGRVVSVRDSSSGASILSAPALPTSARQRSVPLGSTAQVIIQTACDAKLYSGGVASPHAGSSKSPSSPARRPERSINDAYSDADYVSDHDFRYTSSGTLVPHVGDSYSNNSESCIDRPWYLDDTSLTGTPVGPTAQPVISSKAVLPPVKSKSRLWQNMLYLLTHRKSSLPALLDYHDLYPQHRSIRSYNLLIGLAVRRASFGTAQWLLASMREEGIRPNLETWKLKVRWLVRSGWWEKAWQETVASTSHADDLISGASVSKPGLPLPIWLEFCAALKRGAVRRRARFRWAWNEEGIRIPKPNQDIATEHPNVHIIRQGLLHQHRPVLTSDGISGATPKSVYFVVLLMLRSQQHESALSFTNLYLTSIPRKLSATWVLGCLDIIHLHMVHDPAATGLPKAFSMRRTLVSMLKLHRALRPTSSTLFLLLSPLARAKRCGTVAAKMLRSFKRQWGVQTEDRRVRRRVAALAIKEGRHDIVKKILRTEEAYRWSRRSWALEKDVLGGLTRSPYKKLLRLSDRKLHGGDGKEERFWYLLRRRSSRLQLKRRKK